MVKSVTAATASFSPFVTVADSVCFVSVVSCIACLLFCVRVAGVTGVRSWVRVLSRAPRVKGYYLTVINACLLLDCAAMNPVIRGALTGFELLVSDMTRMNLTRRKVLASIGSGVTAALAGCFHGEGESTPTRDITPVQTDSPVPTVTSKPPVIENRIDEFTIERAKVTDDGFLIEVTNMGSEDTDLADYAVAVELIKIEGGHAESLRLDRGRDFDTSLPAGESVTVTIPMFSEPGGIAWFELVLACPGMPTGDAEYCTSDDD